MVMITAPSFDHSTSARLGACSTHRPRPLLNGWRVAGGLDGVHPQVAYLFAMVGSDQRPGRVSPCSTTMPGNGNGNGNVHDTD
jgi:hypothetical protein